ncbi:MAG: hypothetical protein IKG56_05300 [Clostridia bacterium]|nr:hypothetical protein [Clostridia bacterium]
MDSNEWKLQREQIYRLDLSKESSFVEIGNEYNESYNIGIIEDENGNIYGNRKERISLIE